MNRSCRLCVLLSVSVCAVLASVARADVRLPHVIGSNMVLQQGIAVPIWGWAAPGEEVTVTIAGQEIHAQADREGRWTVRLSAMSAGGPHDMVVTGRNTIRLTNILVGEVWVCSGQSNMEMGVEKATNGQQEVAAANYPQMRLFEVPRMFADEPVADVNARWAPCSPSEIREDGKMGFSATAYFFGRELHKQLGVPVGLINASWGGTRIEEWTPAEAFSDLLLFGETMELIAGMRPDDRNTILAAVPQYETWYQSARQASGSSPSIPVQYSRPIDALPNGSLPTRLYNAMVHPLVPFAVRGVAWYQGEENNADGMMYCDLMKAMIGGWRKAWGQGDFSFYYVQIAPLAGKYPEGNLPRLWEAQRAAMAVPNTGMVVTTDIGDLEDIHPKDKQDVGQRLALWAVTQTYGRHDIVCSGPLYKSMKLEGDRIRLMFDYAGGGLVARDGRPLNSFQIAGADERFVKADATIDGETVLVHSDVVRQPVAVRFGWNNAAVPNLMNQAGLPASPFRTDRWPPTEKLRLASMTNRDTAREAVR